MSPPTRAGGAPPPRERPAGSPSHPSGLDAWRDFQRKVADFLADGTWNGVGRWMAIFERLAVTEQQIADFELPTRPTKTADTRAKNFTGGSVEVDAIPAPILRELIKDAITRHIDSESYRLTRIAEDSEREVLQRIAGWAS